MRKPASGPDSRSDAVAREAAGVPYLLRRSARARRLRLVLDRDGVPLVTLPVRAPVRLADEFVASRQGWIGRQRVRYAADRERHRARGPLANGGAMDFSGQAHRLDVRVLAGARRTRVEHDDNGGPVIRVWLSPDELRPLPAVLEAWLRREAREAIGRRLAARAPQVGASPASITIRDQRTRWGSASRRGRLSFSWRLVLAPPAVLDYVVVHELAHLVIFGHPPEFWTLVRSVVPDADGARRWLRDHARELHWSLEQRP